MNEQIDIAAANAQIAAEASIIRQVREGMGKNLVGQHHLVDSLLVGLLSGGHVLLEGAPGLAKTLAIRTLASLVKAQFSRIQFTPDLLPADVIGTMVYSQKEEQFATKKGPIFANIVLADEINRAPAKVQSALLEAMQEHQVTIGGTTYSLPEPFMVLATENPLEQEGTYRLAEAQADRFMLKVLVDYPSQDEEKLIIRQQTSAVAAANISPVVSLEQVQHLREVVDKIYMDDKIVQYITDIVFATRAPKNYGLASLADYIEYGGSPRASIGLAKTAKAYAFLCSRAYVVPEDVRAVAHDVLRHRIGLSYEAEADGITTDNIINQVVDHIQVP